MARPAIPDPLKRRLLVEEDLGPAKTLALAEAYLAEERAAEALVFLEQAEAHERLAELRDQAVEAGDVFMVRGAAAALGEEIERETWERVAAAAEAAGKERYAHEARRQAERA